MKFSCRSRVDLFFIFFFLVFLPSSAYTYIDPGTGSYFIQILIATLAGGLFALKIFWKRIIAFLKSRRTKLVNPDSKDE